MENAGFIVGSWVLTLGSIGAYAVWIVRRSRALSRHATTEDMPWT